MIRVKHTHIFDPNRHDTPINPKKVCLPGCRFGAHFWRILKQHTKYTKNKYLTRIAVWRHLRSPNTIILHFLTVFPAFDHLWPKKVTKTFFSEAPNRWNVVRRARERSAPEFNLQIEVVSCAHIFMILYPRLFWSEKNQKTKSLWKNWKMPIWRRKQPKTPTFANDGEHAIGR